MSEPRPRLAADWTVWAKIGWLSFGGPAGQIALMQRLLVDELRWISQTRFVAGLNLCLLLPGPEAQQLATYVGWTRQGWRGGLVAGGLFILPGALVMSALAAIYVRFGKVPAITALFSGIQCAVVAIVVEALIRLGRRSGRGRGALAIAGAAYVAISWLRVPYPLIMVGAALAGLALGVGRDEAAPDESKAGTTERHLGPALAALAAWLVPVAIVFVWRGSADTFARIGVFYSELAVVTFGGAYAVLTAIVERAVTELGWLTTRQVVDGLGLAETTPGPLVLVLQFVAFVAGAGSAPSSPLMTGLVAGVWGAWVLFAPSFVWIFAAAPVVERLAASPRLRAAVAGAGAAVVGVVLHLAIWFALHVLFGTVETREVSGLRLLIPDPASLHVGALTLVLVSAAMIFVFRRGLVTTLAVAALGGLLLG
jgi:chromate transporter